MSCKLTSRLRGEFVGFVHDNAYLFHGQRNKVVGLRMDADAWAVPARDRACAGRASKAGARCCPPTLPPRRHPVPLPSQRLERWREPARHRAPSPPRWPSAPPLPRMIAASSRSRSGATSARKVRACTDHTASELVRHDAARRSARQIWPSPNIDSISRSDLAEAAGSPE